MFHYTFFRHMPISFNSIIAHTVAPNTTLAYFMSYVEFKSIILVVCSVKSERVPLKCGFILLSHYVLVYI